MIGWLLAAACVPAPASSVDAPAPLGVVLAQATADYQTGLLAVVDPTTLEVREPLATIHSDAVVAGEADAVWVINRLLMDTVRRYAPGVWDAPVWEVSVGAGTNPHAVARCGDDLFVSRYGATSLLVLDPETGVERGEVDLSGWADADGLPEASDLVVLPSGEVLVGMQRLRRDDRWRAEDEGAVVAVDCETWTVQEAWSTGPNPVLRGAGERVRVVAGGGVGDLGGGYDGALVVDMAVSGDHEVWVLRDGEQHQVVCDGVAGPTFDAYVSDVELLPDGAAWLAMRPPWSDPTRPGAVLRVDPVRCEVLSEIPVEVPPYSIAAFGAW